MAEASSKVSSYPFFKPPRFPWPMAVKYFAAWTFETTVSRSAVTFQRRLSLSIFKMFSMAVATLAKKHKQIVQECSAVQLQVLISEDFGVKMASKWDFDSGRVQHASARNRKRRLQQLEWERWLAEQPESSNAGM